MGSFLEVVTCLFQQVRGQIGRADYGGVEALKSVNLRNVARAHTLTFQLSARNALIGDPMFQLPNAQCREQKAFRAGERTDGWKVSDLPLLRGILSGAAPARFS